MQGAQQAHEGKRHRVLSEGPDYCTDGRPRGSRGMVRGRGEDGEREKESARLRRALKFDSDAKLDEHTYWWAEWTCIPG